MGFRPPESVDALTVETIFRSRRTLPPDLDPALLRVVIATGDVIPARYVNVQMVRRYGFTFPWEATADILRDADLRFINLETPLLDGCELKFDGMEFCGDSRAIEGLRYAGIDVASLANNHSGDYGPGARERTAELLATSGIGTTGQATHYEDVRGARIAFLGFDIVGRRLNIRSMQQQVAEAREQADIVIVQYHWGGEYSALPAPWPDDPRTVGKLTIDAGADLVIGNHPHWVQGIELYRDRLITYAHGNFIFDQDWSREVMDGVIGRYTFYGSRLIDAEFIPIVIWNQIQPRPAVGTDAERIMAQMRRSTDILSGRR